MMDQPTIAKLTEQYRSAAWIFPKEVPYTFTVGERFPWGGISVNLLIENGMIREAKFFTDAMEAGLFTVLEQSLVGSPSLVSSITARLRQKQDMIKDEKPAPGRQRYRLADLQPYPRRRPQRIPENGRRFSPVRQSINTSKNSYVSQRYQSLISPPITRENMLFWKRSFLAI